MPSAYILAKDNIEQARAILGNDIWFDSALDHLLSCAIIRLGELDTEMDGPRVQVLDTIDTRRHTHDNVQFFRKSD